jgi:UDP-N-acetylglucosamine 2-epimerase (non-hydrolysing)
VYAKTGCVGRANYVRIIFVLTVAFFVWIGTDLRIIDFPKLRESVDVMAVIGTRPEAIKMAPVIKELMLTDLRSIVITTGQHADMLSSLLNELGVRAEPTGWSRAMKRKQSLTSLFNRCALSVERAIERSRPRLVVVQGDTTTALAAAHAAFYARVPVAHVEAGLRTHRMDAPFPEEFNRKSIAAIACFHFAPTKRAEGALIAEGMLSHRIWVTGNTAIDAALEFSKRPLDRETAAFFSRHGLARLSKSQRSTHVNGLNVALLTCHRRENHNDLDSIVSAVKSLLRLHTQLHILLPVHPNPAVRDTFHREFNNLDRMHLLPPLTYGATITILQSYADIVITDSGGLQEESTSFHVPVVVLREVTERPEGVEHGVAKLVGTNTSLIISTVSSILDNTGGAYDKMARNDVWPYGDGHAAGRIVKVIHSELRGNYSLSSCNQSGPGALPPGWRRSNKHYGGVCRIDPFFEDVTVFFMLAKFDIGLTGPWFRNFEFLMPCYKRMVILAVRDEVEDVLPVVPPYATLVPMDMPGAVKADAPPNEQDWQKRHRDITDRYYHQVYAKFVADRYLRDDDTKVLFVEADSALNKPIDESCFLADGKIVVPGNNGTQLWKNGTEYALGTKYYGADYYVARTPVLLYRSTLLGARRRIEEVHGMSFDELSKRFFRPEFTWKPENTMFSEFNTLAVYAVLYEPSLYTLETDPKLLPGECSTHHQRENHPIYRKVNKVTIERMDRDTACGLGQMPDNAPNIIPRPKLCRKT